MINEIDKLNLICIEFLENISYVSCKKHSKFLNFAKWRINNICELALVLPLGAYLKYMNYYE